MRIILAIAGVAILAATPALATGAKKKPQRVQPVQSQAIPSPATPIAPQGGSYTVQTYTGSRIVGRDPDASVRQMLQAEDAIFRNIN